MKRALRLTAAIILAAIACILPLAAHALLEFGPTWISGPLFSADMRLLLEHRGQHAVIFSMFMTMAHVMFYSLRLLTTEDAP